MFYKFIRLVNGENILATTDDSCEDFSNRSAIEIHNPVLINSVRFPRNGYIVEAHVFTQWIAGAETEQVILPTKNIVVAVNAKENIAEQYKEYLTNMLSDNYENESEISFNELEDNEEDYDSEEEETNNEPETRRIIH